MMNLGLINLCGYLQWGRRRSKSYDPVFSRPGRSQRLLYKHLCYLLTDSLILKWEYLYGAVTPKQLQMVLLVNYSQLYWHFFRDSRSWRASKSLNCLKSYSDFADGWNFPTGWASLGRVCAGSLRRRLVFLDLVHFVARTRQTWKSTGATFVSFLGFWVARLNLMASTKQWKSNSSRFNMAGGLGLWICGLLE